MQPPRCRRAAPALLSQWALAAAAMAWTLLLLLAPYFASRSGPSDFSFRLAAGTYLAGRFVCHQRADRSFHEAAVQLPVCARCFGLYASASAGALIACAVGVLGARRTARSEAITGKRLRGHGRLLVLAAVPTLASVVLEWAGVWRQDPMTRCAAAVPLGIAVGWFVTFHAGQFAGSRQKAAGSLSQ
jgi:hypothetical protein